MNFSEIMLPQVPKAKWPKCMYVRDESPYIAEISGETLVPATDPTTVVIKATPNIRYASSATAVTGFLQKRGIGVPDHLERAICELNFGDFQCGLFAARDVPAGSILCPAEQIVVFPSQYRRPSVPAKLAVNDLAFYPFMQEHEYSAVANVERYTNVKFLRVGQVAYLQAVRDIVTGEELSRLYGRDYWFSQGKSVGAAKLWKMLC